MSLTVTEGFDMYNGVVAADRKGLQARWADSFTATTAGTLSFLLVPGRFAGQALQYDTTANYGRAQQLALPAGSATLTIGFAFRLDTLATVGPTFPLMFTTGANFQWAFGFEVSGQVSIYRTSSNSAGTQLGISGANVLAPVGNWHYFVITVTMATATTGSITVYMDGVAIITLTNVNLLNYVTSNLIDAIHFGAGRADNRLGKFSIDDIYIDNAINNRGERRVETLRPVIDSGVQQWVPFPAGTPNAGKVNETLVDGDTTYVQGSLVNDRDLYTLTALSSTPSVVDCVNIVSFAEKTDVGARSIFNSIKSGATNSDGAAIPLTTSYARNDRLLETDPNTAAAWTPANVNALLLGPKVAV